jgi:integrase
MAFPSPIDPLHSDTVVQYDITFQNLSRQLREQMSLPKWRDLCRWFQDQNSKWRRSTVRAYRAALLHKASQQLTNNAFSEFKQQLRSPVALTPKQFPQSSRPHTKRKYITAKEWDAFKSAVYDKNRKKDLFALDFLSFGLLAATRPIEVGSCMLEGDNLIIKCAKATQQRACTMDIDEQQKARLDNVSVSQTAGDKYRVINISAFSDVDRAIISRVLERLPAEVAECGGWAKFYQDLRNRCRRISDRAGIFPVISPAAPRHEAISAIKSEKGSAVAGAIVGHCNDLTSETHYKHSSSRSKNISKAYLVVPDHELFNSIKLIVNPKENEQKISLPAESQDGYLSEDEISKLTMGFEETERKIADQNAKREAESDMQRRKNAKHTRDYLDNLSKSFQPLDKNRFKDLSPPVADDSEQTVPNPVPIITGY